MDGCGWVCGWGGGRGVGECGMGAVCVDVEALIAS